MTSRALSMVLAAWVVMAAPAQADTLRAVAADYDLATYGQDGLTGPGWPDVTPAAVADRLALYGRLLGRLQALAPEAADPNDADSREILTWRLQLLLDGARFDEERIPFDNGDGFFNTANYAAAQTVIRSVDDAQAWIARLRALPAYYDAQIANMRRGLASGFTQPRSTAAGILVVLEGAAAAPVEHSPLLAPFERLPATMPVATQAALRLDAVTAMRTYVKPAQAELVRFFREEYVPAARQTTAARSLPDGEAYYRFLIRRSTTLDLSPDDIAAAGTAEVARLTAEMERLMRASGWTGTLAEFIADLRSNPRYYAADLPTYIEKASEIGKRIDALLPRYFAQLPRLPWGIRIKPAEMEASSSGYDPGDPQRGVAGAVVVGARSFREPLTSLPAWILHEGVPGHHLQIALAQERTDLPEFRRKDDITAFVEGWALYAEDLGEEMGVYRNPLEQFGHLAFNAWRACRLVMDVGIHWHGVEPALAEQCLLTHTTLPRETADYETARYVAWPTQALAYKLGELEILRWRRQAERALGARFDLRAFHSLILEAGPMPLPLLDRHVQAWIAARTSTPSLSPTRP